MEGDETESSTPQSSVVSSVVIVDNKKKVEGPGDASKTRYLERLKDLDLEDLACRQELTEILELKSLSHEDLSNHLFTEITEVVLARDFGVPTNGSRAESDDVHDHGYKDGYIM